MENLMGISDYIKTNDRFNSNDFWSKIDRQKEIDEVNKKHDRLDELNRVQNEISYHVNSLNQLQKREKELKNEWWRN